MITFAAAHLTASEAWAYTRTFCTNMAIVGQLRRRCPIIESAHFLYFDIEEALHPAIVRLDKMGVFIVDRSDDDVSIFRWRELSFTLERVRNKHDWWWRVFEATGPEAFVRPILDDLEPLRGDPDVRVSSETTIFTLAGLPYIAPEGRDANH